MELLKKKLITVGLVTTLTFSGLVSPLHTYAGKNLDDIREERTEIKNKLSKTEKEIVLIVDEIEELDAEIAEIETSYKENEKSMKKVEKEIKTVKEEIKYLEKKIEERFEILTERAKSYQQTGGNVSYLEVILGSKDFSDFISRMHAITQITDSDAVIIEEQEKEQAKIEDKLVELEELELEIKEMKKLIKSQKTAAEKMKSELDEKHKQLEDATKKLKKKDNNLAIEENELVAAAQAKAAAEAAAKAEAEAQAAKEEENRTVKASNKQSEQVNNSASKRTNKSSNSQETNDTSTNASGGKFAWPAQGGYISSTFGHRWGRMHKGIDIARTDRSTKPAILAAQSGTVETAGNTGNGYGNMVIINHGNGLKTLYAHLDSLSVSSGQKVSRGQRLGVMGATGNSTGVHLHFEVHRNGSPINPAPYIR